MENLKKLMKDLNDFKPFSEKDKKFFCESSIKYSGDEHNLIISMEEMAELIDVLVENLVKKTDKLHTAEEIIDVYIMISHMQIIFGIKDKKLTNEKIKKGKKRAITFYAIKTIANTQKAIAKYLRNPSDKGKKENCMKMIPTLYACLGSLCKVYEIKNKDLKKLEYLKYSRFSGRLRDLGVIE